MATAKKTTKTKAAKATPRASTTATFLKSRVSKPTLGKWSSGFSAVKKYADENKIPLIAVWSNGDACGHCTTFETAVMNSTFTKWMGTSKCVFWFGCSSDTSKDDKMNGTGYNWAWGDKSLKLYPFVRVWWKEGKVDKYDIGDNWIGASSKGYNTFINKLKSLLKKYLESTTTTTTTTTTTPTTENGSGSTCEDCNPTCDGGSCSPDGGGCCSKEECDKLKKEIETLKGSISTLKGKTNAAIAEIQEIVDKLESEISNI